MNAQRLCSPAVAPAFCFESLPCGENRGIELHVSGAALPLAKDFAFVFRSVACQHDGTNITIVMKRQQENTMNVIFSGRLAEQMRARGITQQELASSGGCTQSAISLYLKGRIPSGEVMVKLARALGTTAEVLCGFQPLPKNDEVHEWRLKAEVAMGKVEMLKSGMEGLLKKI